MEGNKLIPPWRDDASSLLVVFSILAVTSGVILAIVLPDIDRFSSHWWLNGIIFSLLAASLWLFISTGERVTDALDEDDVEKFVSLFIPYNLAVICLFTGTFLAIYSRCSIAAYIFPSCLSLRIMLCAVVVFFVSSHWIGHIYWLISVSNYEYNNYLDELKGLKKPEYDRGKGFDIFMKLRRIFSKKVK